MSASMCRSIQSKKKKAAVMKKASVEEMAENENGEISKEMKA
jgi:hypothetical protein